MSDALVSLARERDLLRAWLFDEALPHWTSRGLDVENGGFHEKLDPTGRPTLEPRRARVTARQAYAFTVAGKLGWPGGAQELASYAFANLFRRHLDPERGMVVATVAADGRALRQDFDLYDHAFVLFCLATAVARGERVEEFSRRAARLLDDMRAGWAHPMGGFVEDRTGSQPLRANPHMHMLEAALAWLDTSEDLRWATLADELAELCLSRFIAPNGAVREYFDRDWNPLRSDGFDIIEPGHQFEWGWLLLRWGRLRNRDDAIASAWRLLEIGEDAGVCTTRDLAINELHSDLTIRDGLARLWAQTERIKAHSLAMAVAEGAAARNVAAARAARAAAGLRRYFEHPLRGAWWEHLGLDGAPVIEPSRTTSLYHIVCAIDEMVIQLAAVGATADACIPARSASHHNLIA